MMTLFSCWTQSEMKKSFMHLVARRQGRIETPWQPFTASESTSRATSGAASYFRTLRMFLLFFQFFRVSFFGVCFNDLVWFGLAPVST